MSKSIVLGIDPGFSFTGYAIIKKEGSRSGVIDLGYLKLPAKEHLSVRIGHFHDAFELKITQFQVTDLALETPFLGKNAQNFLKLGYLRGILYFLAHKHSLKLHEFSPREVKQSVTGYGGASKDQVARVVSQLFPQMPPQEKLDVTDAVAVTLCGLWKSKQHPLIR